MEKYPYFPSCTYYWGNIHERDFILTSCITSFFLQKFFHLFFPAGQIVFFIFCRFFLIFVPDLKIASFTRKALILKPFSTFCACLSSQCFSFPADCLQNHRWDSFIRWILFSQLTCYKMKLDLDK